MHKLVIIATARYTSQYCKREKHSQLDKLWYEHGWKGKSVKKKKAFSARKTNRWRQDHFQGPYLTICTNNRLAFLVFPTEYMKQSDSYNRLDLIKKEKKSKKDQPSRCLSARQQTVVINSKSKRRLPTKDNNPEQKNPENHFQQ